MTSSLYPSSHTNVCFVFHLSFLAQEKPNIITVVVAIIGVGLVTNCWPGTDHMTLLNLKKAMKYNLTMCSGGSESKMFLIAQMTVVTFKQLILGA